MPFAILSCGSTSTQLKPLNSVLGKCWKNIGQFRQHTQHRLKEHNVLKLEDEVVVQKTKIVWRWEKNELPKSLRPIIEEKHDNLRGSLFNIPRGAKPSSIISRLNKRASSSMTTISVPRTKKKMSKTLKNTILESYSFVCRRRDCFICQGRALN